MFPSHWQQTAKHGYSIERCDGVTVYRPTARLRKSAWPAAYEHEFLMIEAVEKIERLQKDAARYQWLRSRDLDTIDKGGVFAGMTPANYILNEEDLDQAIDDAMAATSVKEITDDD